MASGYYNSTKVVSFPVTYRTQTAGGKYTSEVNITNLLKTFIKNKSFVASYDNGMLKVVINGYYFEYKISQLLEHQNLYLYIRVINGYLVNIDDGSVNLDSDGKFKGLAYCDGGTLPPVGSDIFTLKVTDGEGNLINTGFIPTITDENGNWYDFSKLINIFIVDNNDVYIDPHYIKDIAVTFNNFTVGAAKKLVDNAGNGISKGKIGVTVGSNIEEQWIYFNNGIPKNGNKITISNSTPGSSAGVLGDFWFQVRPN